MTELVKEIQNLANEIRNIAENLAEDARAQRKILEEINTNLKATKSALQEVVPSAGGKPTSEGS